MIITIPPVLRAFLWFFLQFVSTQIVDFFLTESISCGLIQGQRGDGDAGSSSWRLEWIPRRLKENVKVVLSVSDDQLLDALKRDVVCSSDNYVEVCIAGCFLHGSQASWKVMEVEKGLLQAWKVTEDDCGHGKSWKIHGIPPIGQ